MTVDDLADRSDLPISSSAQTVRAWASQLAAESRVPGWSAKSYVWPEEVTGIWDQLENVGNGIIAIVGFQGVGKSSALQAIYGHRLEQMDKERGEEVQAEKTLPQHAYDAVLFKWRRRPELSRSLLNGSHEASESFLSEYLPDLWNRHNI